MFGKECSTGWEMPELGEVGYLIQNGEVEEVVHTAENDKELRECYNRVELFSHPKIARHALETQVLLRKLRRFASLHRVEEYSPLKGGYTIMYNYGLKCLEVGLTGPYLALGDILFDTEEIAQMAINEYRKDLMKYFTQTTEDITTMKKGAL